MTPKDDASAATDLPPESPPPPTRQGSVSFPPMYYYWSPFVWHVIPGYGPLFISLSYSPSAPAHRFMRYVVSQSVGLCYVAPPGLRLRVMASTMTLYAYPPAIPETGCAFLGSKLYQHYAQ
ncbi:hypothetical protein M408DRAFT_328649 [Serendipita vermifera MAFF 305830]|uniref:Uncharacterized protein n=1 Tax=Serendipita vermifera MAFF 305830 TaxID=933852 RepID=A0A0C2XLI9_SERVB|nr:hypothetical protein M408DRAFT_328649 [Serendipita vermifera MAFF 305830]